MRHIILILIIATGCTYESKNSSNQFQVVFDEYLSYLPIAKVDSLQLANSLSPLEPEISFIERGRKVGLLLTLFDQTSDVRLLNRAADYQEKVVTDVAIKKEKHLRKLAQIYIKQHRFQAADSVITVSRNISDSRQNKYIAFDIAMELGNYQEASKLLESIKQENDFSYLIRAAKWKDYKGELSKTIDYMLKAKKLAEAEANNQKLVWLYANLGDYYGHDNQINKSYDYYLKTLELDPQNHYALRKIAFILYAHEHNYAKALAILDEIQKTNGAPDIDLLKAEVLSVNSQPAAALMSLRLFEVKATSNHYHNMYNGYLIKRYIQSNRPKEALALAQQEIENRTTPETYAWLAAALLATNDKAQSLHVIEKKVHGKTFEPKALLTCALVKQANGIEKDVLEIKEELAEASFELGPYVMQKVESL